MIKVNNNTIFSDEDKYLHKIGSESYFKKCYMLPTDTIDMFEEVDELPKQTQSEYKLKVRDLIKERYTLEDEIAILANINSPMMISDDKAETYQKEYLEWLNYRNECKIKAKNG